MSMYGNYISDFNMNIIERMRIVYESFPLPMKSEEYIFSLAPDLFKQYNREVNYIIYRENDDVVRGTLYFRGIEIQKIDISEGKIILGKKHIS